MKFLGPGKLVTSLKFEVGNPGVQVSKYTNANTNTS